MIVSEIIFPFADDPNSLQLAVFAARQPLYITHTGITYH